MNYLLSISIKAYYENTKVLFTKKMYIYLTHFLIDLNELNISVNLI
jgi:hypothetical protein